MESMLYLARSHLMAEYRRTNHSNIVCIEAERRSIGTSVAVKTQSRMVPSYVPMHIANTFNEVIFDFYLYYDTSL